MRVSACIANFVGKELLLFLVRNNYDLEFVVTCEGDLYEHMIHEICEREEIKCYRKADTNDDFFIRKVSESDIDLVLLLWWPKIVKQKTIDSANIGFINLHPSLLPYNRGKHPYYWSIVENTPAGVSIHFVDSNIDEGDIIAQREIDTPITITGDGLYRESVQGIIELFKDSYKDIASGKFQRTKQDSDISTFHFGKDIEDHSRIDLNKNYKAIDLINIIRGRSFDGSPSSYFLIDDKKYYINIKIWEDGGQDE